MKKAPQVDANTPPPPAGPDLFSRPRPRAPRSASQAARIRVQNRRRQYLENNPGYLSSADNQNADPDLYDTLVRSFQTPAEREAEVRGRGWGKVLESSLMRGEDRLDRVASSLAGDRPGLGLGPGPGPGPGVAPRTTGEGFQGPTPAAAAAAARAAADFAIDTDLAGSGRPASKEEGRAAWEDFLRDRFVRGGDDDFDYAPVDGDEGLDELESRDREEEWFDEEEPRWASDGGAGSDDERVLVGQTGVQDY